MEYSFVKGFYKALTAVAIMAVSYITFAGLSDITVWGLVEQYLKPLLGALTLGGVGVMVVNYLKVKSK